MLIVRQGMTGVRAIQSLGSTEVLKTLFEGS